MTDHPCDEQLNAFVDGELGPAEADALLERVRLDPALRERLAQLQWTKGAVRHAHGEVPARSGRARAQSLAVRGRARQARGALVALALFAAGTLAGWLLSRPPGAEAAAVARLTAPVAATSAGTQHVVLHLSADGQGLAAATLERAEGLMQAARDSGREVTVEIVANGTGLDLLRVAVSGHAQRIASMQARYPALALVACGQTVQRLRDSGADVRLLPGTRVASSALDEIVQRLQQGWAYVRI